MVLKLKNLETRLPIAALKIEDSLYRLSEHKSVSYAVSCKTSDDDFVPEKQN